MKHLIDRFNKTFKDILQKNPKYIRIIGLLILH